MAYGSKSKSQLGITRLTYPLIGAAVFSGIINILALAGPLFMLEVYDRVIPSHSVPTLIALLVLVGGLYGFSGLLDVIRGRIFSRIAGIIDTSLSNRVFEIISGASLKTKIDGDILKPAQEMDQVRNFLASNGPAALFDLPWMPIYLTVCFFLHPLIGWLATGFLALLVILTLFTDAFTRSSMQKAVSALAERNRFGEAAHNNAEAIAAMGMINRAKVRWNDAHDRHTSLHRNSADVVNMLAGFSKSLRLMVQSGSLALGAYLVIQAELTGGMIIAASVIVARTLAPIEQVIANWRSMLAARQAWDRLQKLISLFPEETARTTLSAPTKSLSVEGVFAAPPGARQRMAVQNVTFRANAGSVVGIIGPSASGKSSLARAITNVWSLSRGNVRLDGASIDQWPVSERGKHVGYMPQSSDLFPGTIAENIARLDPQAEHSAIIIAAQAAGIHELIVGFPDGYDTQVGDGGVNLSAGQRQRVALARALFGEPFLVVLDEPNSNLDADGDAALSAAIDGVKARGGIVLVVAHRKKILSKIDYLLVLENSVAKAFGPRDAVLSRLENSQSALRQRTAPAPSLATVSGEGTQL